MKRTTVLLACAVALACLLIPAAASAAYTTNDDCLKCHAPAGSGAISRVEFATYAGQGDVALSACYKCHNPSLLAIGNAFQHNHANTDGLNCAGCHANFPSYGQADPTRLQAPGDLGYVAGVGYFNSTASILVPAAQLHAIHVNGSWPQDVPTRNYVCSGCHGSASCSTCHLGAVKHGTHSSTKYAAVTYTTAFGQPMDATAANKKSETVNCVNADCHSRVAAATSQFVPFCGTSCHIPPADTTDRTKDHGYDSIPHTATVSAVVDPGEVKPCGACHSMDLMTEHARPTSSGPKSCATCHPAPENTIVGPWNKTCVTWGCHVAGTPKAKHGNMTSAHATVTITATLDCYSCHKGDLAAVHAGSSKGCLACHGTDTVPTTHDCTVCHTSYHANQDAKHAMLPLGCDGAGCHPSPKLPEDHALYAGPGSQNPQYADSCSLCHSNPEVTTKGASGCSSCHPYSNGTVGDPHWKQNHKPTDAASAECVKCHSGSAPSNLNWVVQIHKADGYSPGQSWANCATCHNNPTNGNMTFGLTTSACANCHKVSGTDYHKSVETSHAAAITPTCVGTCHDTSLTALHATATTTTVDATVVSGCFVCHAAGAPDAPIKGKTCETCHFTFDGHYDGTKHTSTWSLGAACSGRDCHAAGDTDLKSVHNRFHAFDCMGCHGSGLRQAVKDAIAANKTNCDACHADVTLTSGHMAAHYAVPPLENADGTGNYAYVTGTSGGTPVPDCATCHRTNLVDEHLGVKNADGTYDSYPKADSTGVALTCQSCHRDDAPLAVKAAILAGATNCDACHTIHGKIPAVHATTYETAPKVPCGECHKVVVKGTDLTTLDMIHPASVTTPGGTTLQGCQVCHGYFEGAYGARVQRAIDVTNDTKCTACHDDYHADLTFPHTTASTMVGTLDCARCHDDSTSTGVNVLPVHEKAKPDACAVCHDNSARVADITAETPACISCHTTSGTDFHRNQNAKHTFTAMDTDCQAPGCHSDRLDMEHAKYLTKPENLGYVDSCALCHENTDPTRIDWATATAACTSCHTTAHPAHLATASPTCVACHVSNDAIALHAKRPEGACAVCHNNPARGGDLTKGTPTSVSFECAQTGCHDNRYPEDPKHYSETTHTADPFSEYFQRSTFDAGGKECNTCHSATLKAAHAHTTTNGGSVTCIECHTDTALNSKAVVAASWPNKKCVACHDYPATKTHATYATAHVVSAGSCAGTGTGCHDYTDLAKLHDKNQAGGTAKYKSCENAKCHDTQDTRPAAVSSTNSCGASDSTCHNTGTYHPAHLAKNSATCIAAGCHVVSPAGDVMVIHANSEHGKCAVCHGGGGMPDVTALKTTFDCAQSGCHTTEGHPPHIANNSATCVASGCHRTTTVGDVMQIHVNSEHGKCAVCHGGGGMNDVASGKNLNFNCAQSGCHADVTGSHHELHNTAGKIDSGCAGCHYTYMDDEHSKLGYTCATCHSSTNAAVVAAIKANDVTCDACHPAVNGKNRHAGQYNNEFIGGNSGGHNSLGMSYAKTSFKIGTATYTWPLPTTSWLQTGWTSSSVVTCKDCHTFSSTAGGPHGSAVTVNIDPKYPTDWSTVYLSGSSSSWGFGGGGSSSSSGNGASSSTFICAKCHQDFGNMNSVHGESDHGGRSDGTCVMCHSQVPHGWRLPRLLAYKSDPAPYNSLCLTGIKLKSYTPTNWSESDCGQSGCGEHNSSVSPLWPSTVQLPNGTLTGVVKNAAGTPISDATVAVTGDGSTKTDATGKYTLSLPQGQYTITASATGYTPQSATVTVTSKITTTHDFVLAPAPYNIAQGKIFTASKYQTGYEPAKAGDGSTTTRWATGSLTSTTKTQWLQVDLGSAQPINKAVLYWYGNYYARAYQVQVSANGTNWTTVYSTTSGTSGTKTHTFATTSARYVKVTCTEYYTSSGYGMTELQVWTP